MKRPRPHAHGSDELSRHSVGLSASHIELIKLLAAAAVAQYLGAVEAGESADDRDEVTR